jgi:hypothetical protein
MSETGYKAKARDLPSAQRLGIHSQTTWVNSRAALTEETYGFINILKMLLISQVLVAHTCNPSYSGGGDQEDCGSQPARANSSQDPISKNTQETKGLVEWLKVKALSSSPSSTKKKNYYGPRVLLLRVYLKEKSQKFRRFISLGHLS